MNPNTQAAEFSLRDPDGYYVTIRALSAPRPAKEVTLRQARGSVSATLPKDMADRAGGAPKVFKLGRIALGPREG